MTIIADELQVLQVFTAYGMLRKASPRYFNRDSNQVSNLLTLATYTVTNVCEFDAGAAEHRGELIVMKIMGEGSGLHLLNLPPVGVMNNFCSASLFNFPEVRHCFCKATPTCS